MIDELDEGYRIKNINLNLVILSLLRATDELFHFFKKQSINCKGLDNEAEIVSAVDKMQENIGKKSFAEKYNAFIQSAANHMTIFAPFIPALTTLLTTL